MKKLFCFLAVVFFFFSAFSQKTYFIYLQSEQAQPFYIKLGEKTYSSSSAGYIILSKLVDSNYNIIVGFPKNKWPEQKFSVNLNGKDKGYLLKNFQDGSWGIMDLQTAALQIATAGIETNNSGADFSLFTRILSKAANDPSLIERPVVIKQQEPVVVAKKEVVAKEVATIGEKKPEESIIVDYKRSVITKKSESSTSEGFGLIFIDDYMNGNKDTITIVIPHQQLPKKAVSDTQREKKKNVNAETKKVIDQVYHYQGNLSHQVLSWSLRKRAYNCSLADFKS